MLHSNKYIEKSIIRAALNVHKNLGTGLPKKVYEVWLCYELSKMKIRFRRQVNIPFTYDYLAFEEGSRVDILVEDSVICELKAVNELHPIWKDKLLNYMKLTNKNSGYLINFNAPVLQFVNIKRTML